MRAIESQSRGAIATGIDPGVKISPPGGEASCDCNEVRSVSPPGGEVYSTALLLDIETYANIECLLIMLVAKFTSRWPVSPLGGEIPFLAPRMEGLAYFLVAGGEMKISPRHVAIALLPILSFFIMDLILSPRHRVATRK